jgi:protein TonB
MASPRKRRILKAARAKKATGTTEAPVTFEDTGTIHAPEPPVAAVEVAPEPEPKPEPTPEPEPKPEPTPEPVVEKPKAKPAPKKTTRARKPRRVAKKEE